MDLPQRNLLEALYYVTQSPIGRREKIEKPGALELLEKDGMLKVDNGYVYLTSKGKEVARKLLKIV